MLLYLSLRLLFWQKRAPSTQFRVLIECWDHLGVQRRQDAIVPDVATRAGLLMSLSIQVRRLPHVALQPRAQFCRHRVCMWRQHNQ